MNIVIYIFPSSIEGTGGASSLCVGGRFSGSAFGIWSAASPPAAPASLTGATSLGAVDVTAAPPDQQLDSPQPIASELGVATQVIGDIQGEI